MRVLIRPRVPVRSPSFAPSVRLAGLLCALALAGCLPRGLEGEACETGGESACEGDAMLVCNGREWQRVAACSHVCVERSGRAGTDHSAALLVEDEAWTCSDGPHRVTTNVSVPAGVTLTLEAGALVKLVPASRIVADPAGRVAAIGTAEAPILVTADNGFVGGYGTALEGAINVFAVEGDTPAPSRIQHTIIERGRQGLGVFGLSATARPPLVENNAFRDNEGFGIRITCNDASPVIPDFVATNEFFGNGAGDVGPCP